MIKGKLKGDSMYILLHRVLSVFFFICSVFSLILAVKFFNEKKLLIGVSMSGLGIIFSCLAVIFFLKL
jgi:uncharacterized membrane protein